MKAQDAERLNQLRHIKVRQVIRAGQARKLYREFCRAHGRPVEAPAGEGG